MDELQTLKEFRSGVRGADADERVLGRIRDRIAAEARTSRSRRPLRRRLLAVGLVAAAVAAALAVLPGRESSPSLVGRALAALGSGSVLHVVAEAPTGRQLVDIGSGQATPVVQQDEIWFDDTRGLRRDVARIGGRIVDDTLETPAGGWTPHGIVIDCAWIAAHPVQATNARVSCNAAGDNGTTPRTIPRAKPTLDPGLAGFADGYRQALASGAAREGGSGVVDGRPVDWLLFDSTQGVEKVALDASTHKPVLLVPPDGSGLRILTIESVDYAPADFRRPTPDETPLLPSGGDARDGRPLPLDGASIAAADPGALWAGASVGGLPLVSATLQTLVTSYVHDARPSVTGAGLELEYGHTGHDAPYAIVSQAPSPELAMAYMWDPNAATPRAGTLYSMGSPGFAVGMLTLDGRAVTIQASSGELMLAAARALTAAG